MRVRRTRATTRVHPRMCLRCGMSSQIFGSVRIADSAAPRRCSEAVRGSRTACQVLEKNEHRAAPAEKSIQWLPGVTTVQLWARCSGNGNRSRSRHGVRDDVVVADRIGECTASPFDREALPDDAMKPGRAISVGSPHSQLISESRYPSCCRVSWTSLHALAFLER